MQEDSNAKPSNSLQQPDNHAKPSRMLVLGTASPKSMKAHKLPSGPSAFSLDGYHERFPELYLNLKSTDNARSAASQLNFDDFDSNEEDNGEEQLNQNENTTHQFYTKLTIENGVLMKEDPRFRDYIKASRSIRHLLDMRDSYICPQSDYTLIPGIIEMKPPSSEPNINYFGETRIPKKLENIELKNFDGVFVPFINDKAVCTFKTSKEYLADMKLLLREACDPTVKTFCYKRLCLLSERFKLHCLFNREKEFFEQKMNIHRDFYNIRKIDNQIDHTAAATVNTFVKFVIAKTQNQEEYQTQVTTDPTTKESRTLAEVFEDRYFKSKIITLENLQVQSYLEHLRRFNSNIESSSHSNFGKMIGEIFLERDNTIKGRFLAELTHAIFREYESYKFQYSEFRIQVFGKEKAEWSRMAEWFSTYKIYNQHVRWLIQIPRLFDKYRKDDIVKNFQEVLDNIFQPLFDVTIDPESNPDLHKFLFTVVGFDTVDDENGYSQSSHPSIFNIFPSMWTRADNPHFCYWAYYLWANIYTLNALRKSRGFNTFTFRPHVGEAGSIERLISVYLLAHGISQGALLNKAPLLHYLFYLKQIGVSMSPLSENKMYLKYKDNPFPEFFARGMNVSLSTDRPLLHHLTEKPLIEEYSIVGQIYDLNSADMCELARNSVIQSGFEDILKSYWIGEHYKSRTPEGNDEFKSNVPRARYLYRIETLDNELNELKVTAETCFE